MRLGVVLAGLAVTALTLAVSAWAAGPLHVKSTDSGSFTFAAGELCDFNYEETFTVVDNASIFGDPDNPDKVIHPRGNVRNTHEPRHRVLALGGRSPGVHVHLG